MGEDKYDAGYSHAVYKKDLVERLDAFGLVNSRSVFAHGIHFTPKDRELLNERDAFLVHNCRSNMNNNVGYNNYLPEIKNLALGTDGIGGNMIESMKFAFFKHRDAGGPLWPDGFLNFLHQGNRLMERHFGGKFGRLEPGYAADLTVLDYDSPTPLRPENIGGHLVFGMSSRDVYSVMINGCFVYENRAFPGAVNTMYKEARESAEKLWKRMDQLA
jgi:cytosine/adenosine deaminase-related metal-dependent hydrolase